jgi:hypothetical protein
MISNCGVILIIKANTKRYGKDRELQNLPHYEKQKAAKGVHSRLKEELYLEAVKVRGTMKSYSSCLVIAIAMLFVALTAIKKEEGFNDKHQ